MKNQIKLLKPELNWETLERLGRIYLDRNPFPGETEELYRQAILNAIQLEIKASKLEAFIYT
jgi:hypothetical protein